jgi:hypothetical protein
VAKKDKLLEAVENLVAGVGGLIDAAEPVGCNPDTDDEGEFFVPGESITDLRVALVALVALQEAG